MSVNKVILVGRLGKDPEARQVNETTVVNFTMATSESYKDKQGQKVENTTWHNVVLWRGIAEVAQKYLKKGDQVYIEGKIQNRSYEDKDGNTRYITEIVGQNLTMLGGGGKQESSNNDKAAETGTNDLPF